MNPLLMNPWVLAGAAVAVIAIGGFGYVKGVSSQAKETAVCEASLGQMKEVQRELEQKAEQQRRVSERITKDVSKSWSAALDYAKSHPRIVRVRSEAADCSPAGLRMPAAASGIAAASPQPGLGTPRATAEVELTIEEINRRLNNAEHDAAQLAALIDWHKQVRK